jgi:hypothetical protein
MVQLSLKQLDERLLLLESDRLTPTVEAAPEWLDDVMRGVVAALFNIRQQGAYTLAKELEAKYLSSPSPAGDTVTLPSELHSAGKEE